VIFRLRLWVSDGLFALAAWLMPEHYHRHRVNGDGTIDHWREAA
jgi:hypothetical protein